MRRTRIVLLGVVALMGALSACNDEDPIAIGDGGLIGNSLRTYEVVLDAGEFLRADTTFDRLGVLNRAPFNLVAKDFAGELDARTLFSLSLPTEVTYGDTTGTRTDSIVSVVGGTLTLIIDTLATSPPPIQLEVHTVTEDWDWLTATWELRNDTVDGGLPWTTAGGALGQQVGAGRWTPGDTLQIPLDSQAVALWQDSTAAEWGGLLRATTQGSRLVLRSLAFEFDVVPEGHPDTVVQAGSISERVTIATPEPSTPDGSELRVGGLPTWRSFLRFQPLGPRMIPCGPGAPAGCSVALEDVTVNLASLLLQPLPVGGHRIERAFHMDVRAVLQGPENIPLTRSPLSSLLGSTTDTISARVFIPSVVSDPVEVRATSFVRRLVDPPDDGDEWSWLALTATSELSTFGYGAFGSLSSTRPPRLRLVVSVPEELER